MTRGKQSGASARSLNAAPDDNVPEWKRQSVERSLQTARARAQQRSDRFVSAAVELMQERGDVDFTVQDVVDRSRMSIRTFYNFFASKDDLLVAVHETILAREVVPRLRARCARETEPVAQMRAYIQALFEMTADPGPASRALTTYSNRLAESRPTDLTRAMEPQIALVEELIGRAVAIGALHSPLRPKTAAHLLHNTVLSAVHARILGAEGGVGITADELWTFCALGLGIPLDSTGTA